MDESQEVKNTLILHHTTKIVTDGIKKAGQTHVYKILKEVV